MSASGYVFAALAPTILRDCWSVEKKFDAEFSVGDIVQNNNASQSAWTFAKQFRFFVHLDWSKLRLRAKRWPPPNQEGRLIGRTCAAATCRERLRSQFRVRHFPQALEGIFYVPVYSEHLGKHSKRSLTVFCSFYL